MLMLNIVTKQKHVDDTDFYEIPDHVEEHYHIFF